VEGAVNSISGDPKTNLTGEFTWTATPGTHVFRVYLRTKDGSGKKIYTQDLTTVQISGWETNTFSHPGLNLSEQEVDTIRYNVFDNPEPHPMKEGWKKTSKSSQYEMFYQGWETIDFSDPVQSKAFKRDENKLMRLTLRWIIGGEDKYAEEAIRFLNAYASTVKQVWNKGGDVYPFLHVTHTMQKWIYSAEILKHYKGGYTGWSNADRDQYDKFVRDVLVPVSLAWWGNTGNNGGPGSSNQPLNVAKARMMLGIYLDDKALFQSGYDHMFNTLHTFTKENKQWTWPDDSPIGKVGIPLNQFQPTIDKGGEYTEINRLPAPNDHVGMSRASAQNMADMLCHQGYDMYDMIFGNETTPRYLQGANWLLKGVTDGINMSLHNRTVKLDDNYIGDYEAVYNHYKYRSTGDYDISSLEQYVMQQRANKAKSIGILLHADLAKDMGQTDCSWGGAKADNGDTSNTPPTAPSNLSATATSSTQVNLSWSDNANNETGFQVERSVNGVSNWSVISTTTANTSRHLDLNLTALTTYFYRVRATNADGYSEYTSVVTVTTSDVNTTADYCASKGVDQSYEEIQNIQIGSINNNSSGGNGYSDFTAINSNLSKGEYYTVTVTPKWLNNVSYKEGYVVWIDYNHNGIFTDSGEQVLSITPTQTTPATGTFTVPSNITNGSTRMRISMMYDASPRACGAFEYGEVEDYTVNIID
jgi:hypothetical protein